jgi:hypothetical protein
VTTGVGENDIVPDKVCEKELVQEPDQEPVFVRVPVGEPDQESDPVKLTVGEPVQETVIVTFGEPEKELYETIHV